jgi:hypothetical protein
MIARPDHDLFDRDAFGLPVSGGAVPDTILAGLAKLSGGPPLWGSEIEWLEFVDRMRTWSARWYGPATAAGWSRAQLFGLSADAPQLRRDLMGGAWMANMRAHQTVAIDRDAIRVVARTAARLSIYRPQAGGVLAWELNFPQGCRVVAPYFAKRISANTVPHMHIRARLHRRRLQISLIDTRRVEGKVRQEHVASLGSVPPDMTVQDRLAFWTQVHPRLSRLDNRLDGASRARLMGALHKIVPMVTPDAASKHRPGCATCSMRWSTARRRWSSACSARSPKGRPMSP